MQQSLCATDDCPVQVRGVFFLMDYYTLLTIVYPILEYEMQFSIWFSSERECWSVLMKNGTLYDQLNAISGHCDVSEVASRIVRPEPRPW